MLGQTSRVRQSQNQLQILALVARTPLTTGFRTLQSLQYLDGTLPGKHSAYRMSLPQRVVYCVHEEREVQQKRWPVYQSSQFINRNTPQPDGPITACKWPGW
jgi:hypothetical protein